MIINFFSETIAVLGYCRSIIHDIPRGKYFFIPNDLYHIINKYDKKEISKLITDYHDNEKEIKEYIQFLEENEFVFFTNDEETKLFPKLNLQWDYPAKISNAIIETKLSNFDNLKKNLSELIKLNCFNIQIFSAKSISISKWNSILNHFSLSPITSIEIFSRYNEDIKPEEYKIIGNQKRIKFFFLHGASTNDTIDVDSNIFIYKSTQQMNNFLCCGIIDKNYFNINMSLFTESQHYNTCLNRKICIDANGEIKNCPAMSRSFGNIKDTTLEEALNKPGFKDLWGIRKDDIDVCKDCEFRYMCTDCRAFIKDTKNICSQPAKCPYNPYIAKWEGEEGYITVEEWRAQNPNWEKKAKRKPLVKNPQKVE